jgi:predicted phage tail protein
VNRPNVTLTWTPPTTGPAPTAYTIVASLSAGGPVIAQLPAGTQTSVTVAAPDGTFFVRVVATVNGALVTSNEIRVDVVPPALPLSPQNLRAAVAGGVITFDWQAPSGSVVTGYVLEAGSTPGLSNLAALPLAIATTFVTPPVPNGSYYVRVRAQNTTGTGPASNEVRVVVGPPPPSAPTLTGSSGVGGTVTLSWSVPSSGAPVTGYQLHAGSAAGASDIVVIDLPATQTALVAASVPAGTYYVRVRAMSASGPGMNSNEVTLVVQ